jgi:amino acid transporter
MESASIAASPAPAEHQEKGLKKDAIGFSDGVAIGLASTAPAYSLAAVIGSIVVATGLHAPGILLLSFVPMFFIAAAFFYLNRADQDCGTTFSWVTRAMGPYAGFMGGWAICTTGILVVGSLADVSAFYTYDLFGLDELKKSREAVITFAVVIIVVMTTICVIGTQVSARLQRVMTFGQVGILLLFVVVGLIAVITGDPSAKSLEPQLSWLSPFGVGYSELLTGVLLAVFIYWGWESAVNLSEETEDSARAPGLAGLVSTIILLATYVLVGVTLIAVAGLDKVERFDDNPGILSAAADEVLGPLAFLLVVAVIVSGISSAQTTILPGSRTSLSMAASGALPKAFAHVHKRFLTPDVGTIVTGGLAIVWYVGASAISDNFLFDSLSALSLLIAFYYGLTGFACAIYYRHELLKSAKNFIFIGVAPMVGALMLLYLLVETVREQSDPAASYSGDSLFGLGIPLVIAIFFVILGLIAMVAMRLFGGERSAAYFHRKPFEAVPPEVATGEAGPIEGVTAPDEEK